MTTPLAWPTLTTAYPIEHFPLFIRLFPRLLCFALTLCALMTVRVRADDSLPVAEVQRAEPVDFETEILPLLRRNCIACHNATNAESDLVLETPQSILRGGTAGPGVVPGKGTESLVFLLAAHRQESFMPPEGNDVEARNLTPQELGLLKLWIDQGAKGGRSSGAAATVWQPLPTGAQPIYAVAVTPRGGLVAAGRANQVSVYSVPLQQELGRLIDPELLAVELYENAGAAHREAVQSLAFRPDGRQLASGGFRTVKIWSRDDSYLHTELPAADAEIRALAVCNDGRRAAVAQADGNIQVYDVADGKLLHSLRSPSAGAVCLAWSADASHLVGGTVDGMIQVWNLADAQQVGQLQLGSQVNAVAVIDEGRQIIAGGDDAVIRLWPITAASSPAAPTDPAAVELSKPSRELAGHSGPITAFAVAPHQPRIFVSASLDGTARLWNAADGKPILQLAHGAPVGAVAIRPDGKRIATADVFGVIKLWNAEDGKQIADLTSGDEAQRTAELRREVELAARHVQNAEADVEAAKERQKAEADNAEKAAAELLNAEMAAQQKAEAAVEDAAGEKTVKEKEAAAMAVEVAKRTSETAKAALERAVADLAQLQDLLTTRVEQQQAAEDRLTQSQQDADSRKGQAGSVRRPIPSLAFSPDGVQLAVADDAGHIAFYSSESGDPLHPIHSAVDVPAGGFVAASYVSSNRLLTAADRSLAIWASLPSWSLQRTFGSVDSTSPFADRVTALDFSPTGELLATGGGTPSRSGDLHLWNSATGERLREIIDAHSDVVLGVAFSEDGEYIASCSADGIMKVFETGTGNHVRSFEGHSHHVLGVSWRADGRQLATSGADHSVKIWDFRTGEAVRSIDGFKKELTAIDFLGVSDQFVISTGDKQVLTRNTDGGSGPTFAGATDYVYAVRASRDGTLVVSGGQDGVLRVWDQQGKPIATFPPGNQATDDQ